MDVKLTLVISAHLSVLLNKSRGIGRGICKLDNMLFHLIHGSVHILNMTHSVACSSSSALSVAVNSIHAQILFLWYPCLLCFMSTLFSDPFSPGYPTATMPRWVYTLDQFNT